MLTKPEESLTRTRHLHPAHYEAEKTVPFPGLNSVKQRK